MKRWALLLVLIPTLVGAFEFKEDRLACRSVQILRDDSGKIFVNVHCESFAVDGTSLRVFDQDIYPLLNNTRKTQVESLFDGAANMVRNQRGILTPGPTSTP